MLKKIISYIKKWHMLEQQDVVVAGISGGADSVCLLFVLLELKKEIGFQMIAVHVNHELRGSAADGDECFVQKLCAEHEISCIVYHKNVELIAKNRKQSMEEAGRNVRKEAFSQTMKEYHGTKLALAHHQNDNAETLLLNLSRGTGIRGLGGMGPVRNDVIRPLLCLERTEVETYLLERQIPWREDATNAEDDYARNRIRHNILPVMSSTLNHNAVGNINRTMDQLRDIWTYMEEKTNQYYEETVHLCHGGAAMMIEEEAFQRVPEVLKPMIVHKVLVEAAGQAKDIASVHIESVQLLLGKQTGRKLSLPYGVDAVRCYEGVRIEKSCGLDSDPAIVRPLKPYIHYRVFDYQGEECPLEKDYTKWFDYDIMKNIVNVRTRRAGDYITIDNVGHTQKLKTYFINEKVPHEERDHVLLLAEGSHILWIIGYRTGNVYRINEHTKRILEIQIDGGEKNGGNSPSVNTGEEGQSENRGTGKKN